MKIKEIMRLWEQGYSQRQIAASVKCAKSTVGEVQRRCKEQSLVYADVEGLTNEQITQRLYPKQLERKVKPDPDWKAIHERLMKYPRLTLSYIWEEEYIKDNPEGLSYSQFRKRYRMWVQATGKKAVMVMEREPGKELFVDFMGDTLECVVDTSTGELVKAHFFVATLGDSNYPYVEAMPNEGKENWLQAHINAFEWYGGIPRIIVPDNCRVAVTKASKYDPVLNPSYRDLATYYDVAVIPARVRRPRDKSRVEGGIGWLETWLLEWLRDKQHLGFDMLNREIRKRLKKLAEKPYQKRYGSRQSIFEEIDKPALRPLPATRFECADYSIRKVPDNYAVEYDGIYYSVPYNLLGQKVTMRVTARMVEIMNSNGERVALHERKRDKAGSRYVMKKEHMPLNHQHQLEANRRTGDDYRKWAKSVGEQTYQLIDTMLRAQSAEETAYKSCMGILQMRKSHGDAKLEAACEQALNQGRPYYGTVKELINKPAEKKTEPLPPHDNLRDPAEFV